MAVACYGALLHNNVCDGCPPSLSPLRESMAKGKIYMMRKHNSVPVIDQDGKPLMPTKPKRARKLIASKQATPFFSNGIFCIRLNKEPSARNLQPIAVGIDPGSKREGISIISKHADFLNIQLYARMGIKEKMEKRKNLRKSRRYRKTPCRKPRWNCSSLKGNRISPSTKARWDWKLRIVKWISKLFPISQIIVEDIKAGTIKGKRKWNRSFSPLEVGKKWFYDKLKRIALLSLKEGWETKNLRDIFGLKKSGDKLSNKFESHCVDSWVLAADNLNILRKPINKDIFCIVPLDFRRRSLHLETPKKRNIRRRNGGTRTEGFRKGSLIKSKKFGLTYLGGSNNGRVSLHSLETGKRLTTSVKLGEENRVISYNSIRFWNKLCL